MKVLVYILEQEMQYCDLNTKKVQHSRTMVIEASIASHYHLHTIIPIIRQTSHQASNITPDSSLSVNTIKPCKIHLQ
jgi:hypothetical protein